MSDGKGMAARSAGMLGPLLPFCLVLALAACAGIGAVDPQKRQAIRTIGIVSALPTLFHVQDIGLTVFGNDLKEIPIGSWGVDDYVITKIRALLGKRYEVRPVVYDRGAMAAAVERRWGDLGENIKAHISTQGLDAYLVLRGASTNYSSTNQVIEGFGIVEHLNLNYFLFALYSAKLVDGHDYAQIGSSTGKLPDTEPSVGKLYGVVSQRIDQSWWPTSLDASSNPRLKAALLTLVDQSLPVTLQRLGLVE